MKTSTLLILTTASTAALYVKRSRTRARLTYTDPRGPSRYEWTPADVSSAIQEARARGVEEHKTSHRYAMTLNPGIRGTRCVLCGEFFA